jgi:outer membrane lipoprotein-sorting protein
MSDTPPRPRVSVPAMLLGSGPRFARDPLGPARTGLGAAVGLGIALTQAAAGLATGSAVAYCAPAIVANAAYGLAFIVSIVLTGLPLTAALTAWSMWYGVRGLHRSRQWSWALRLGLVVGVALTLAPPAHAQSAADIVAAADRYRRPGDSFVWKITITSQEAKKAPAVDGFEVFVKGAARSFVRFVAPPRNVGRSLLALGRDLWIYLPDAGKPVRIPFSQRLVGQVANGDIARADYAGDYDATLTGEETVDGVACHVLELKAKGKEVTYAAIKYWVTRDGRRPHRAEFYAATGTLLKTGSFENFREVTAGHTLASRLTLVDAIRKDRRSVLDYGELTMRDLPEKYFDKTYMKSLD